MKVSGKPEFFNELCIQLSTLGFNFSAHIILKDIIFAVYLSNLTYGVNYVIIILSFMI
jgi:hypothetical protein